MANPKPPVPPGLPNLHMPADLQSVYANLVRIAHTPAEFVFDFARMLPGDPRPTIQARILMSPLGVKLLLAALNENLAKYEAAFGEIHVPQQQTLADFLFKPPAGSAEEKPGE